MNRVFNQEVAVPVLQHDDSIPSKSVYFGFPFKVIRDEVIELGRTDFTAQHYDKAYGTLNVAQIALCYSFINMKRHFFSAYANFRLSKQRLESLFAPQANVVLIDIGCGPGTAGLAFAELFPKRPFTYYGVDRARAMRDQARKMMKAAIDHGVGADSTRTICKSTWENVPTHFGAKASVILNFSFFFGSPFLTLASVRSLGQLYKDLVDNEHTERVLISYTNSSHPLANDKYKLFLKELGLSFEESPPKTKVVTFFKNLTSSEKNPPETFLREIFEVSE